MDRKACFGYANVVGNSHPKLGERGQERDGAGDNQNIEATLIRPLFKHDYLSLGLTFQTTLTAVSIFPWSKSSG